MKAPFSYKIRKRKVIFNKGPVKLVDCEVLTSHGKKLSRQIIEHPGAVVIIPRIRPGKYLLIRQFRFAAADWLWEWPAGGIEPGESLRQAASRELMEETGFKPKRLKKMTRFYPTPGVSGEVMHLYLAENLIAERLACDEDEEIEIGEFSYQEIRQMIQSGKICDAKTMLGFYLLPEHNSDSKK